MTRFCVESSLVIRHSSFEKGFTLVELMVVIVLLGLVTSLTVMSMSKSVASKRVETAAWMVASLLREGRMAARQEGRPYRVGWDEKKCLVSLEPVGSETSIGGGADPVGPSRRSRAVALPDGVQPAASGETGALAMFDARGRTASPVRVVVRNRKGEAWSVLFSSGGGRVNVAPGDREEAGASALSPEDEREPPVFVPQVP